MGVFGPRNPLFQEMGIRGPVWGRGNPNSRGDNKRDETTFVAHFGLNFEGPPKVA